jgi:hypothetical protein
VNTAAAPDRICARFSGLSEMSTSIRKTILPRRRSDKSCEPAFLRDRVTERFGQFRLTRR